MEILLLRHGKPVIDTSGRLSANDFGRWVAEYNRSGIEKGVGPSDELVNRANAVVYIVSSHLTRSIESVDTLNRSPDLVSEDFRECEMPFAGWSVPKLSKRTWAVLFRLLQWLGYSPNAESYSAIKQRANHCARHLAELARTHDSVMFVGHGALIWFLHRELLQMGWSGPMRAVRRHWEYGIYRA